MKFSLKNIAIIILINILLCFIISVKILNTDTLYSPSISYKNDFWEFESLAETNISFYKSKCITHPNFYSPEEIINIFQFNTYKPCIPVKGVKISYNDGVFDIKCPNNKRPLYGVDKKKIETYGGGVRSFPKWLSFLPPLANKQFVFIKCSISAQYAFVFNHFNKKAANTAKNIQIRLGDNKEQMSVLLLVFDSISKYSFERDLPLTKHFLHTLEGNKEFEKYFSVYQFNKSAIPKPNTRPNMAQILYGKSWEKIAKVVGENTNLFDRKKEIYKMYQINAIWKHFSSLGYVTMFSHGAVFNFVSAITGKYIDADHVFTNFWRYLWGVTRSHPFQNGQKCLGGRNFHDFSLDYTYQFFDNYPDNNKFAYVHSDAAHENTGNVRTIDEDLLRFLNNFLKLIKTRGENLAIFLMSDHGNKRIRNSSQWDIRSFFEFHTPFTYLIMSKKIIKSLGVHENLKHNEEQLVSRYDINLSLKHLAYFPYNMSSKNWYQQAKKYYTYNQTVSLFEEKINVDRTCADIGVDREHCICSWYEPLEMNDFEDIIRKEMINLLNQYFNNTEDQTINYTVSDKLDKIKASNFIIKKNDDKLIMRYKLEVKTKQNLEIVADFNFCLKDNLKIQEDSYLFFDNPYSYLEITDEIYFLQLSNVSFPGK